MYTFIEKEITVDAKSFDKIANKMLNNTVLVINGKKFRICEIEFYLHTEDHEDEYVHKNKDQLKYGKWYFHQYKNGTYKSGTYKGMDLALGEDSTYCGILIRSIYDMKNKELIEGPCRSVNKILEEYDCKNVIDFTNGKVFDVLDNKHDFVLKNYEHEDITIYKGKRVGLSAKYEEYQNRPYRYLIMKDKIKKQKKDLVELD